MRRAVLILVAVLVVAAVGAWRLGGPPRVEEPLTALVSPPPPSPAPSPAPPPAPPPEPPTPTPAVQLRISVLGPGERPVEGAAVAVTFGDAPPTTGTTGAQGLAVFEFPGADHFRVLVTAPGFVRREGWGPVAPDAAPHVVRLEREGVLRGRVTAAAGGDAVAGARVRAEAAESFHGMVVTTRGTPFAESTTDADGRFRLEGVALEETVLVTASAPGFRKKGIPTTLPADREPDEMAFALPPGGALAGKVWDTAGLPVAGALVLVAEEEDENLLHPGSGSVDAEGPVEALTARTGGDGAFVVEGLPLGEPLVATVVCDDGRRAAVERGIETTAAAPRTARDFRIVKEALLRVRVLGPDGKPAPGAWFDLLHLNLVEKLIEPKGLGEFTVRIPLPREVPMVAGARDLVPEVRRVPVAEGQSLEVEFRLARGVSIGGIVVDESGDPLAGVEVEADPVEHDRDQSPRFRPGSLTDGDGRFLIEGLRPGGHELTVRAGEDFRSLDDLRVEAPATGVRIVLGRVATVAAHLRLPPGATPPDSLETWRWTARENGRSGTGENPRWGAGTVTFERVPPGTHTFEVRAKGFLPVEWTVEIEAGEDRDLGEAVLDPGHAFEGRVVDPAGNPVPGATVVLRGRDDGEIRFRENEPILRTDAEGRFSIAHLPKGGATAVVSAGGYLWSEAAATLPSPPVTVVLRTGGRARCRILLPEGVTDEGLVLRVERASGEKSPYATAHGFRIPGDCEEHLPPGRWLFLVRTEERAILGTAEAEVVEAETVEVTVDCRK